MNLPIYNLTPDGQGNFIPTKSAESALSGSPSSYLPAIPLGSPYTDLFQKSRAPTPHELIQQLVGTAYACATLNADLVASSTLRLYIASHEGSPRLPKHLSARPASRKSIQRLSADPSFAARISTSTVLQEITQHPILDLLKTPHSDPATPGLSGYDLRWTTQLYLESVGRAYWLVERDGLGIPTQLWLLRSHLVREVPDPTGRTILSHYEYGSARYRPDEIIRFHFPDPNNPYLGGYSPLAAAIEKIRIARKEDAHLNAMLDNMGRPDAIWSPKGDSEGGGIGSAEAQRLRSAFRQAFAQAGHGGLLISEIPGSLQPLQWSPQDVVELQRAKAIKTDICNVFAVPDAKLERNAANLAGAKTADYAHKVDAGQPRCKRIEETLNARLVPLFDPTGRLFLAYDNLIPDDEVFVLEQTRTAGLTGAITRNEIRAAVGLNPVEWGDLPLAPNSMVDVDPHTGHPHHLNTQAIQSIAQQQREMAEVQTKLIEAVGEIALRVKEMASTSVARSEQVAI